MKKKKTATKCGIGITPLIDSHPLETSKSYQKKKKKFKCEVSAYANLTYCIILVTAATKVTDSDFSLSLSFEEHLLRYCVPMVSAP